MIESNRRREVNPRRESVKTILNYLGGLFRGEVTLVAVDTELLATRVVTDPGTGSSEAFEEVVDTALRTAPLTVFEARAFEDFYDIPQGTLWNRNGHTVEFDVTRIEAAIAPPAAL